MRYILASLALAGLAIVTPADRPNVPTACAEWRSDVPIDVSWDGITGLYTNAGIYAAITDGAGNPKNDGGYLTVKNEDPPAGEYPIRFNQGGGVVTVGAGQTYREPLGSQVFYSQVGVKNVRVHFTYCRRSS